MLMTGRCGNDESCQEEKRIFLPQSRQKCSHTPQPLSCPAAALPEPQYLHRSNLQLSTVLLAQLTKGWFIGLQPKV